MVTVVVMLLVWLVHVSSCCGF